MAYPALGGRGTLPSAGGRSGGVPALGSTVVGVGARGPDFLGLPPAMDVPRGRWMATDEHIGFHYDYPRIPGGGPNVYGAFFGQAWVHDSIGAGGLGVMARLSGAAGPQAIALSLVALALQKYHDWYVGQDSDQAGDDDSAGGDGSTPAEGGNQLGGGSPTRRPTDRGPLRRPGAGSCDELCSDPTTRAIQAGTFTYEGCMDWCAENRSDLPEYALGS